MRNWPWLVIWACGGGSGFEEDLPSCSPRFEEEESGCDIVGRWRSIERRECGLGPNGPALCRWSIEFYDDNTFDWQYSDIGEQGSWICSEGEIVGSVGTGELLPPDELVWEGVEYEPVE